ncbi:hypothetical protein C8Q78DRAFT_359303 [Trametes maxima]|nr:hypothetical protein C8Q78DRAFT_359303 [Trametes maxima]
MGLPSLAPMRTSLILNERSYSKEECECALPWRLTHFKVYEDAFSSIDSLDTPTAGMRTNFSRLWRTFRLPSTPGVVPSSQYHLVLLAIAEVARTWGQCNSRVNSRTVTGRYYIVARGMFH